MRGPALLATAALAGILAGLPGGAAGRRQPAPPALLSRTGLYRQAGTLELAPEVLAYSPQYPLWSDGAAKARWLLLPRGGAIDVRDPGAWVFPVGTRFWKQFSFNGRKVETRLLWHAAPGAWVYAAYAWREDQSDADLVEEAGRRGAAEIAPGVFHAIPGVQDCKACHEIPAPAVLGFNALQLSTDRDPGAVHGEPLRPGMATLATLVEQRLVQPARREWLDRPPRIQTPNPRTRAALGYLGVNCGNCHRDGNPIPHVTLDFSHPYGLEDAAAAPALRSALGRPAHGTLVLAPGHPEASLALARMATRAHVSQMPPVGTALVDQEALELLRAWVAQDLAGPP